MNVPVRSPRRRDGWRRRLGLERPSGALGPLRRALLSGTAQGPLTQRGSRTKRRSKYIQEVVFLCWVHALKHLI